MCSVRRSETRNNLVWVPEYFFEVVYKKEYNFKKTRQDRTSKPIKYSYIRSLSSFVELPLSHSIFHLILINTRTLQQERGGERGLRFCSDLLSFFPKNQFNHRRI
ncbi:hypothetical protein L2E82_21531 [Cichorium intybus]|uniref:Uncharacterized protein n=1 Tax=Cichorium intybus TaxID=13427 RepID=A0ACB9DW05_CICIN|nr:hypothetical protein L2E82_21531 [Cichorium intybus]